MHKARKEYDGKRSPIILDKHSHIVLEKRARANDSTRIAKAENEKSYHDREVEGFARALPCQDLNAFLQVDERDVEAEYVAGKASNIFYSVASVRNGEEKVHEHCPARCHQFRVYGPWGKRSETYRPIQHIKAK